MVKDVRWFFDKEVFGRNTDTTSGACVITADKYTGGETKNLSAQQSRRPKVARSVPQCLSRAIQRPQAVNRQKTR